MRILLFGPPGCGKGTQAAFLSQSLKIPAISTGEMFRAECEAHTALGREIRALLARGELIGDEIVNRLVAERTARPDCDTGFLLDGYPRTVDQARYLSELLRLRGLPEPVIIHLDVPEEPLLRRLAARRQCPRCHHIYNLLSQPPLSPGVCDADGAPLITREDDREIVIRARLHKYQEQTGPVLAWYGQVLRVDGSLPPAEVSAAIERALSASPDSEPAEPALWRQSRIPAGPQGLASR